MGATELICRTDIHCSAKFDFSFSRFIFKCNSESNFTISLYLPKSL